MILNKKHMQTYIYIYMKRSDAKVLFENKHFFQAPMFIFSNFTLNGNKYIYIYKASINCYTRLFCTCQGFQG